MNRASRTSYPTWSAPGNRRTGAKGISEFLHGHDKLAALLPAARRMAGLEQDCRNLLPQLLGDWLAVVQFEGGQLVLALPNAALAAKLKQQLPRLKDELLKRGWQVDGIRLKIKIGRVVDKPPPPKQLELPRKAMSALAELRESLENTPRNQALKAAIGAMLSRHTDSA